MQRKFIALVITVLACLFSHSAFAQKVSLSTNAARWADFGSANLSASLALSQKVSLEAQGAYNPWIFRKDKPNQMQQKYTEASLGVRYWPWHVYSGWFIGAMARYIEYNVGGIKSPKTEEGDAYGGAFWGGYSLMITPGFNMEFGMGLTLGYKEYTTYSCPKCGRVLKEGDKFFVLPTDLTIGFSWVF